MRFDRTSAAAQRAAEMRVDARNLTVSERGRLSAMRSFAEALSTAVGEQAGQLRLEGEKQTDFLKRLRDEGVLTNTEWQDFDAVRLLGNKATHGEDIRTATKAKGLAAFDRLAQAFDQGETARPFFYQQQPSHSSGSTKPKAAPRPVTFPRPAPAPAPVTIKRGLYSDDTAIGLAILASAWLFPFLSYSVAVIHFEWRGEVVKRLIDIRATGHQPMLYPILNWLWMLLYTLHHTIMAPFEDNQVQSIWLGHIMALGLCGAFIPLFRSMARR